MNLLRGSMKFLSVLGAVVGMTVAAGAAETVVVHVYDLDFSLDAAPATPRDPTIYTGDTIQWTWDGGFHAVQSVSGSSESFSEGIFGAGHTFSHTFNSPGVFPYYCIVHGADAGSTFTGMGGYITVRTAISGWTFEVSLPTGTGSDNGPYAPEFGALTAGAQASGHHADAATAWSNPAGNGSNESFSSNTWGIGDYYQFKCSTTGYENIYFAFDQNRSSTGPGTFDVAYSLDGSSFTNIVTGYTVASVTWSSGTFTSSSRFLPVALPADASNQAAVYIRLVNTVAPGGASGTNRIDNIVVSGDVMTGCDAPGISDQPDDLAVTEGDPASFSVAASGSGSLSYQWMKDGSPLSDGGSISGSTSDTLSINPTALADAGVYECVVTNDCGGSSAETTSDAATLTVDEPCDAPIVTDDPDSVTTQTRGTTVLSAAATGSGTLSYQWRKGGVDLTDGGRVSGATTDTLTISPTGYADEGSYDVVVSNDCGSATSASATVTTVCGPDCNGDHALNINDFICFQNEWKRKTAYGDYNDDGKWNINDFISFQVDWATVKDAGGCLE